MFINFIKTNYKFILLLLIILFIILFWKIFLILMFSAIFAFLINPLVEFITKKFKIPHSVSVSLVLIIGLFLFGFILASFIPFLIRQFSSLNQSLPHYFNNFYSAINLIKIKINAYNINNIEIVKILISKTELIIKTVSNTILSFTMSLFTSIPYFILIIIFLFYFLKDKETIINYVLKLFKDKEKNIQLLSNINRAISKYVGAQLLDCLIVGILASIGLIILKIDYPIVLGSITAFLTIIPYIGPLIASIPPLVLAYIKFHSINQVLITGILYFVILMINGYVIQPKLIGDSTKLHPMVILILLLMGGQMFGGIGMILSVPAAIILKEIYRSII